MVRLRGLGEGRRYWADRFERILDDSGSKPDRVNIEVLARSAVDNYRVTDPGPDDPWNPDDLVRENELLSAYEPPADSAELDVSKAVGSYLQRPALHYTVGTRITPKVSAKLADAGYDRVLASREKPSFEPEMRRLRVASHDNRDWLASMSTSHLGAQLREAVERGYDTDVEKNRHFAPRLAYGVDAGSGGFGEKAERSGLF